MDTWYIVHRVRLPWVTCSILYVIFVVCVAEKLYNDAFDRQKAVSIFTMEVFARRFAAIVC